MRARIQGLARDVDLRPQVAVEIAEQVRKARHFDGDGRALAQRELDDGGRAAGDVVERVAVAPQHHLGREQVEQRARRGVDGEGVHLPQVGRAAEYGACGAEQDPAIAHREPRSDALAGAGPERLRRIGEAHDLHRAGGAAHERVIAVDGDVRGRSPQGHDPARDRVRDVVGQIDGGQHVLGAEQHAAHHEVALPDDDGQVATRDVDQGHGLPAGQAVALPERGRALEEHLAGQGTGDDQRELRRAAERIRPRADDRGLREAAHDVVADLEVEDTARMPRLGRGLDRDRHRDGVLAEAIAVRVEGAQHRPEPGAVHAADVGQRRLDPREIDDLDSLSEGGHVEERRAQEETVDVTLDRRARQAGRAEEIDAPVLVLRGVEDEDVRRPRDAVAGVRRHRDQPSGLAQHRRALDPGVQRGREVDGTSTAGQVRGGDQVGEGRVRGVERMQHADASARLDLDEIRALLDGGDAGGRPRRSPCRRQGRERDRRERRLVGRRHVLRRLIFVDDLGVDPQGVLHAIFQPLHGLDRERRDSRRGDARRAQVDHPSRHGVERHEDGRRLRSGVVDQVYVGRHVLDRLAEHDLREDVHGDVRGRILRERARSNDGGWSRNLTGGAARGEHGEVRRLRDRDPAFDRTADDFDLVASGCERRPTLGRIADDTVVLEGAARGNRLDRL